MQMGMINTTEKDSNYQNLDKMSVHEILSNINQEDKTVPLAVERRFLVSRPW